MVDLGYGCTASTASFRETLASAGRGARVYGLMPLSEVEVARMLVTMGNSRATVLRAVAAAASGNETNNNGSTSASSSSSSSSNAPPGLGGTGAGNNNNNSGSSSSSSSSAPSLLPPAVAFASVMDSFATAAGRSAVYSSSARASSSSSNSNNNGATGMLDDWRHEVIAAVLRDDHGHLDWARVLAALDFPDCNLSQAAAFQFVVAVVLSCNGGGMFPSNELVRKPWSNTRAHLDVLRHAISAPPDVINFSYGVVDPSRLLQPVAGSTAGTGIPNNAWCSVDLYAVLLRLASTGGPEAERQAAILLEQAQSTVPELVLLGMARCRVDDAIDTDPSGHDPSPLRARVYNTLLASAFGNVLASPSRIAASELQQSILVRLWSISRPLTATSLLALVRGIANRAGNEHEQFRTSMEGVARVVAMTMHLADFVTVFLSAPAPQLAIEVAVYFSQAGATLESHVAQQPVPQTWQGPMGADGQTGLKLDAWLKACILSNPAVGAADRFAAACIAFLKRVVASQAQVLAAHRAAVGAPADGSGAIVPSASAASSGGGAPGDAGGASSSSAAAAASAVPTTPAQQAELQAQEAASKSAVVRPEALVTIFKRLKQHSASLEGRTQDAINAAYDACFKLYPTLGAGMNHEIEETANSLFQRIYTGQITVSDFVELMRRYKSSNDSREREIFQCMVGNLFDEYRYFAKYPDKELRITGVLFGMLIQHQLVTNTTLGLALRYVLDALKKAPTDEQSAKMYKFGVFALEQFKTRLPRWPQYCSHIAAIPHLRIQYPAFVAEIDAVLAAQNRTGSGTTNPGQGGGSGGVSVGGDPSGLTSGMSNSGNNTDENAALSAAAVSSNEVVGMHGGGGPPPGMGLNVIVDGVGASGGLINPSPSSSAGGPSTSSSPSSAIRSAGMGVGQQPSSAGPATSGAGASNTSVGGTANEIRNKLALLGADLTVALAAAASGQAIPAILPSAAAAAAAAKEAEERAAAANNGNGGGGDAANNGASLTSSSSSTSSSLSSATGGGGSGAGISALEARVIDAPPPAVSDRLTFIINNMTDLNVDVKAMEAANVVRPEHYAWMANYIVTKRVATQHNYQPMYRAFLERFGSRDLDREVLRTTLEAAKRLLASDKIKTSTQERSLLKNLGSWLGRISLGRSRPLLYRDMNVKELLWEAYETGRLIAVVAFLAKVLENAAESPVFRPPNPWTMAMLGALRELYEVSDLKLNLKFEVEVLCKALGVDLKDIRPSEALHLRKRPDLRGNPDFNPKAASNPDSIPGIPPREGAGLGGGGLGGAGGGGGAGGAGGSGVSAPAPGGTPSIPGLLGLITLRSFSAVFHPTATPPLGPDGQPLPPEAGEDPGAEKDEAGSSKANLRNVLAVAVDRAVRDLIQPVVERSVTIAIITARELVTKDFALEPDADKMARAAHVLASDLAGSLAVITCQDPLKIQIGTQLRTLLTSYPSVITSLPIPLQQLGDAAVNAMLQGVVNENLEVAWLLVEKAAMERAVRAIDEALAPAYALRRKASSGGGAFVDTSSYTSGSRWPAALPEALRPHAGAGAVGLSERQLRVYESFARGSTSSTEAGAAAAAAADGTYRGAGAGNGGLGSGASSGSLGAGTSGAPASAVAAFSAAGGAGGDGGGSSSSSSAANILSGASANAPVVGIPLTPGQALPEYNAALDRLTGSIRTTAAQLLSVNPTATAASITGITITSLPSDHELMAALRDIRALGLRVAPGDAREQVCLLQAQKLFKGLLELPSPPATILDGLATQTYLAALVVLRDCCRQLRKDLVSYFPFVPEERRYNSEGVVLGLLRSGLLWVPDMDGFLRNSVDAASRGGSSTAGLRFGMLIVQRAVVVEKLLPPSDLPLTIEALLQIANRQQQAGAGANALTALLEAIKGVAAERARAAAAAAAAAASGGYNTMMGAGSLSSSSSSGFGASSASGPIVPGAVPTLSVGMMNNVPSVTAPILPTAVGAAAAAGAAASAAAQDGYTEDVRQKVLYLLETWVRICAEAAAGNATDKHYQQYLSVLQQQGVLASDSSTERFLRVMMDLCVQSCAATAKPYPEDKVVPPTVLSMSNVNVVTSLVPTPRQRLSYTGVDALSKLVVLLLKVAEGHQNKINLLQKLMGIFVRALIRDADVNGGGSTPDLAAAERPSPDARFDQRPYLRLFCNLFRDLHLPMPPPVVGAAPGADEAAVAETIAFNAQVLATFANVFHLAQPSRVPGFSFAWLDLVSHRLFLPALLSVPGQRGWPLVHRLLIDLFRFLYPYQRRGELNEGLRLFYKGTLRLLLVLLHDYPDFLADYHSTFLEVIPLPCIQLRNLVLAAAPRAVRLPDPFDRSLVPEALPESTVLPRILGPTGDAIPAVAREELDVYLRGRVGNSASPALPIAVLRAALVSEPDEAAITLNRYSLRVMNALVLYLVQQALARAAEGESIATLRISGENTAAVALSSPSSQVLRALLAEMDTEGKYILLNACAAQLRYPNAHTLFCIRFLLATFADPPVPSALSANAAAASAAGNILREQVARVLLERIIVHRPHPWGVLTTITELIRNPANNIWSLSFVHSSPDVERLFESVARSCLGGSLPAGWVSTHMSGSGGGTYASTTSGAGGGSTSVSRSVSGASTPTSTATGNPE